MNQRRLPRYQRDADVKPSPPDPPAGRIAADLSKQAPNNSYGGVPLFYEDRAFTCIDCGKEEVWTAKQQQWWYEVAKGPIYSHAVRCRACRRARRAKRAAGKPDNNQPIRHAGALMKLVRDEIEPAILAAGFVFESRNKPREPGERIWIDYQRQGEALSLAYLPHDARLIAELLQENGTVRTVAVSEFDRPRTRAAVMATIGAFASTVREFLASLPADTR